jgi:hypothetical protein
MLTNDNIDFIGIGVQKSATTWLHQNFKEHQDIWVPPRKELHYFDRSITYPSPSFLHTNIFEKRKNSQEEHNIIFKKIVNTEFPKILKTKNLKTIQWYQKYFFEDCNDEWYKSLFNNVKKTQIKGEITPSYSILKIEDIKKIKQLFPKVKIVLILRNPIDRAWSHVRFHMKLNKFSTGSSINEIKNFIDSPKQHLRSDYLTIIHNWYTIFPKEQVHICFYDEIINNPSQFLFNIFNFLKVSSKNFNIISLQKSFNVSPSKAIPPEIEYYLAKKYYTDIRELNPLIGSYTANWLKQINMILTQKKSML